jgi:polar amino acid transport system substrate-binding protein
MRTPDREKDFYYSSAVLSEEFVFFHLKKLNFDWASIEDIRSHSLLGMLGYSYGQKLDDAIRSGNAIMTTKALDIKQAFKMLMVGRARLYPQEVNIGKYELRKHFVDSEIAKISYHSKPYLRNYSHLLFPKSLVKSSSLLKQFNEKLDEYKKSGKYIEYFNLLAEDYYFIK